ncbi:interleukin-13 receptor subunit alpha-2 [Engystomops pustulosus]|uniref:interleukin-13 receptor subunit alpha-2 n=1 Tax=Engystomops pustulosus TaxID=76066 RepID=UPI003AFA715D
MWNLNHLSLYNVRRACLQWITGFVIYSNLYVQCTSSVYLTVDPPTNIQVKDLGTLGILEVTWQSPASTNKTSECTPRYELTHQVVNEERWKSVRMKHLTYRGTFDLGKNVVVKMRTYLKGPCTEENEVLSEWVEVIYPESSQGSLESKVKSFQCINFNFVNLRCEWEAGDLGRNSNYELEYWQEGMSQIKSCKKYMAPNGINIGCDFGREKFELFSDLFIRVTGVPGMDPIRPSYFIFQLQNIGKPASPENLTMTMDASDDIIFEWKKPNSKIPAHCFQYEIQSKNPMKTWQTLSTQRENRFSFNTSETSKPCIRVRGKINIYCAAEGYWSEWSEEMCLSEPSFEFDLKWLYCVVAAIIILMGFCVATIMYTVIKRRQWSKKLQYEARELVYDIHPVQNPKC